MCGTLKFEDRVAKAGDLIQVNSANFPQSYTMRPWWGFIRRENLEGFWKKSKPMWVHIYGLRSFIEQKTEVQVGPGLIMHAAALTRDVFVRGKLVGRAGSVKILTRPAYSDFEKKIHHRWPLVTEPAMKRIIFNETDRIAR
jgi:hypothetical protein